MDYWIDADLDRIRVELVKLNKELDNKEVTEDGKNVLNQKILVLESNLGKLYDLKKTPAAEAGTSLT
jgi:hypothetical protein